MPFRQVCIELNAREVHGLAFRVSFEGHYRTGAVLHRLIVQGLWPLLHCLDDCHDSLPVLFLACWLLSISQDSLLPVVSLASQLPFILHSLPNYSVPCLLAPVHLPRLLPVLEH